MAGEDSRELSAKVFAGQCRSIALGFRQGGPAVYGLRRQLIDEQRRPKCELGIGAHKSLQTGRVVLVPGPPEEVETVRRMHHMFVEGQSERDIAQVVNLEGKRTDLSRAWTRGTVHQVLTNEQYIGDNVYNRTSFKLKKKRVLNPPDMWVRANGAFIPVVQPSLFEAVRRIVQDRARRFSDQEMLGSLSSLLEQTGWLSGPKRPDSELSTVFFHASPEVTLSAMTLDGKGKPLSANGHSALPGRHSYRVRYDVARAVVAGTCNGDFASEAGKEYIIDVAGAGAAVSVSVYTDARRVLVTSGDCR